MRYITKMPSFRQYTMLLPLLAGLVQLPLSAAALVTFDEATGASGVQHNQSVGWSFNVLSAVTINALGWYDQNQDGLSVGHTVGIWNPSGTLLASVLVPSGATGTLIGVYRTASISSITLNPGSGYVVGGENFNSSTDRLAASVTQTVDPNIVYVDARYANSQGFGLPSAVFSAGNGFYGPMAFTAAAAVPEPTTLGVAGLGLVLLGWAKSAKRRRLHS